MPTRVFKKLGWGHSHAVVAILGGAFAALVVATGLVMEANSRMADDAMGLHVTCEVITQTTAILGALKDAETGQRGFLLTGNDRYLQPYDAAVPFITQKIDDLQKLASNNGVQVEHWAQLRSLSAHKLGELRNTIRVYRNQGPKAAVAIVETNDGQDTMDKIRALIAQMQSEELSWQAARQQRYDDDARGNRMTLIFLCLVSLVPVVVMFIYEGQLLLQTDTSNV